MKNALEVCSSRGIRARRPGVHRCTAAGVSVAGCRARRCRQIGLRQQRTAGAASLLARSPLVWLSPLSLPPLRLLWRLLRWWVPVLLPASTGIRDLSGLLSPNERKAVFGPPSLFRCTSAPSILPALCQ